MRKALASLSIVLVLGGCAQLQTLQNVAKFATATITNPVTKEMEAQIELGFDAGLQVLLAYKAPLICLKNLASAKFFLLMGWNRLILI